MLLNRLKLQSMVIVADLLLRNSSTSLMILLSLLLVSLPSCLMVAQTTWPCMPCLSSVILVLMMTITTPPAISPMVTTM